MYDVGERIVEEILENPGIPITQIGYVVRAIIDAFKDGTQVKEEVEADWSEVNSVTVANYLNKKIIDALGNIQTAKPVIRVRGTRYPGKHYDYAVFREPLTPKSVSRIVKEYGIYSGVIEPVKNKEGNVEESTRWNYETLKHRANNKFSKIGIEPDPNFQPWRAIPTHPEYWIIYDKHGNIDFTTKMVTETLSCKRGKSEIPGCVPNDFEYSVKKPVKGKARKILFSMLFAKYMGLFGKGMLAMAWKELLKAHPEANGAGIEDLKRYKKELWNAMREIAKQNFSRNLIGFRDALYKANSLTEDVFRNISVKKKPILDTWRANYKTLRDRAVSNMVDDEIESQMESMVDMAVGDIVENAMGIAMDTDTEYYVNPLTVNMFINKAAYSIVYGIIKQSYDVLIKLFLDKIGIYDKMTQDNMIGKLSRLFYPVIKNGVLYGTIEYLGDKTTRQGAEFMKDVLIYETVKELNIFGYRAIPKITYDTTANKLGFTLKKSANEISALPVEEDLGVEEQYTALPPTEKEVAIPMDNYMEGEGIDEYLGDEELTNEEEEIVEIEVDDEIAEAIESGEVEIEIGEDLGSEEHYSNPSQEEEGEETYEL